MKAIIWTKYGDPDGLELREIEKPAPRGNEILIRVCAATVTTGDCEMRSLRFPIWLALPMRLYAGFWRPVRVSMLGQELCGEVEAVGKDVKRFRPGDQVFGTVGVGVGAYAEYRCLPEDSEHGVLAIKPAHLPCEEAAAVPMGGLEALHFLRAGSIQSGHRLLIYGAGGSIGTAALQLAKHFGAQVTAVDRAEKLDMLRSIGADRVIDYTKEDFSKTGEQYDLILDVVGRSPFWRSLHALTQNGRLLLANPKLLPLVGGYWVSMRSRKRVIMALATRKVEDLLFLKELIEAGKLRPVIDQRYPLEQTAEAHRYVESGRKKGNVVITVTG